MSFTSKDAKKWSRMGPRATYGQVMLQLIEENNSVYAISGDLGGSSGLQRLMNSHPERYINAGIAEQNLVGVAAGFAKENLIPFASSFAPFITMRCCDQIKMNLGYMKMNVKLVGLGSGVSMGYLGNSHYGLEDIAIMRAIPNLIVICPADCSEIYKAVHAAANYKGPVYIRLTGEVNQPIIYSDDYDFQIGKADVLEEGNEIAIIASGAIVAQAKKALEILKQSGINGTLVNMHTIKPLDKECIYNLCKNHKLIVTVEEHNLIGGLGSAVAEYIATIKDSLLLEMIGLPDMYLKAGDYGYMLDKYGLNAEKIVEKILKKYKEM